MMFPTIAGVLSDGLNRVHRADRNAQLSSASLKYLVPDTVSLRGESRLRQLIQVHAGRHGRSAAEHRALAAGHRREVALPPNSQP